jgi:NAD(P)-dependent dehydrogenase (short-subunit alcohol dehydrogenase family)
MALTGQRVVVIGGSSGMGLATARAAADAGAVVTIASSDKERLDAALADLPASCGGVVVDTRDEGAVADLFAQVGDLDHLIYTAGRRGEHRPLADIAVDEARRWFDIGFWGAVAAAKHAAPRIRPGGSITLTSGTIAVRPTPGTALLAAGGGAVEGLTRGLAVDLAPVRVNAVRPGVIRTPMWDGVPDAMLDVLTERMLTGALGEPEHVAATHLYLMENRFVTGTVLTVDGGAVLS